MFLTRRNTMKRLRICLAMAALIGLASPAFADGSIVWKSGYPTSNSSGTITVDVIINVSGGWKYAGGITASVWQDGCCVTTQMLAPAVTCCGPTFPWDIGTFDISGLTSGATYNVIVEVGVTDACNASQTLTTAPATV